MMTYWLFIAKFLALYRFFWSPIEDCRLVVLDVLQYQIIPFLFLADRHNEKVIVHCAGGVGRTERILAAWLIAGRGFYQQEAIATVKRMRKNLREAILAALLFGRNPWQVAQELEALWGKCLQMRKLNPNFR
jgi:protein-tyrosine phosphatase